MENDEPTPGTEVEVEDIGEPTPPDPDEAKQQYGSKLSEDERKTREDYETELLGQTIEDRQQDRQQRKDYAEFEFRTFSGPGQGILWFEISIVARA